MLNRRLINLVNDALSLNLEQTATLLDDDLRALAAQVQVEQDKTQGEVDGAWAKLRDKATWADSHRFGIVLRSLQGHFDHLRKLEILEDRVRDEQFTRSALARSVGVAQATVLELTHREICHFGNQVA
jgi:hypothetical protein